MNGRITFVGNPWPEGHAATLGLTLESGDSPTLRVHLKSADYYAERDLDDVEVDSDWEAPGVWGNYHAATLSGRIPCPADVTRLADLDGHELRVDHDVVGRTDWDWDDLAFDHCYILGHDAVAGHTLRFRLEDGALQVHWTGKIAQAYVGKYEFDHEFIVVATLPTE